MRSAGPDPSDRRSRFDASLHASEPQHQPAPTRHQEDVVFTSHSKANNNNKLPSFTLTQVTGDSSTGEALLNNQQKAKSLPPRPSTSSPHAHQHLPVWSPAQRQPSPNPNGRQRSVSPFRRACSWDREDYKHWMHMRWLGRTSGA
ncbi:hypothetical protein DV738_g1694, partial [Chaetothyriales sp. CBS 135597]